MQRVSAIMHKLHILHYNKDLGSCLYNSHFKLKFMKTATNIDEQLNLLKNRGMIIEDEKKAKEILLDVGYYRLGFYWFPQEKRNHKKTSSKIS